MSQSTQVNQSRARWADRTMVEQESARASKSAREQEPAWGHVSALPYLEASHKASALGMSRWGGRTCHQVDSGVVGARKLFTNRRPLKLSGWRCSGAAD